MNNFVSNMRIVCRICLMQSDTMVPLNSKLNYECEDAPRILDAFENIFSIKVLSKEMYPEHVCKMCLGSIKISHDLKLIFLKSQKIIEKCISLRNTNIDPLEEDTCAKDNISFLIDSPECKEEPLPDNNCNESSLKCINSHTPIRSNNDILYDDKTESKIKNECDSFTSSNKDFERIKCKDMGVECGVCKTIFKNKRALIYHKATQHNAQGHKYGCNVCGKGFFMKNGLARHMQIHNRDVFEVCPVCGKGFHYRGGLFYHLKIHRNERDYLCEHCDRKFLNISGLKKHIRTHTGEKPFTCLYCGRKFISKNILDNHEKTHTGVKPKICPYCNKGFITTYCLKIHMASHGGTVPCDYCKLSFLNADVLTLHLKFKHTINKQILNNQ